MSCWHTRGGGIRDSLFLAGHGSDVLNVICNNCYGSLTGIRDEVRREVDHDHSVRLTVRGANQLEHIVRNIPFVGVDGTSRRMRPDDRSLPHIFKIAKLRSADAKTNLGIFQRLTRGVVGSVTQVDEHTNAIHFVNQREAQRTGGVHDNS